MGQQEKLPGLVDFRSSVIPAKAGIHGGNFSSLWVFNSGLWDIIFTMDSCLRRNDKRVNIKL